MKTKIYFFLITIIFSVNQAKAQYPIPSYVVAVTQQAYFEEQRNLALINLMPQAKRELDVQVQSPTISTVSPCATIWVYSLDRQTILGPYTLDNSDILSVPIDERLWGVFLEATYELNASVWINGETTQLKKGILQQGAVF
jgi:hypothetical protein